MLLALLMLLARNDELVIVERLQAEQTAAFAAAASELAARADELGESDLATELRAAAQPPESRDPLAGRVSQASSIPVGLPDERRHLYRRADDLRTEHAASIYRLARRASRSGHPAAAFHMLEEVARVAPDYEPARKMLGDQRTGDEWLTPFEAAMRRRRLVWHDRFGWLPANHVERYEAGDRYFRNRWMTADEEQSLRAPTPRGWEVETDHFVVNSNHSLERAAMLAGKLEDFHRFFRRTYTDVFDSIRLAGALLETGPIPKKDKHAVRDFASREQYVATLAPLQPNVGVSTGLYLTSKRMSFFFYTDPAASSVRPEEVLYHEVSHQLLAEADPAKQGIGMFGGFWAIEGFATYLESFDPGGDPRIGDIDHLRIENARRLQIVLGKHVPLAEFESLNLRQFQRGATYEEIVERYQQATGLTHFFLHAEGGRYRDAFLQYIRELYDVKKSSPTPIARLTGQTNTTLDAEYKAYLRDLDEQAEYPVQTRRRVDRGEAASDTEATESGDTE